MTTQIDTLLSRLDGVKHTASNKWLAKCPAHDDRHASLGIKLTDNDTVLMHCFAGCDTSTVLANIGLTFSDLFPETTARDFDPTKPRPKPPTFTARELLNLAISQAHFLGLCIEVIQRGHVLCESDARAVELAKHTVDFIGREVHRGHY